MTEIRPVSLAVQSALLFGPVPHRLIRIRVRFPDIGSPMSEQVGLLRFPGEPTQGDAEPVAPGPTSNHNV